MVCLNPLMVRKIKILVFIKNSQGRLVIDCCWYIKITVKIHCPINIAGII